MFVILLSLNIGLGGYIYYLIFESNKSLTRDMVAKLEA
jgi:hypothetical protein